MAHAVTSGRLQLLAMYGFADTDNPSDAVALMLVQPNGEEMRCVIGHEGLTEELWGALLGEEEVDDDGEVLVIARLRDVLIGKLKSLDQQEPSPVQWAQVDNCLADYVRIYRQGLRSVLAGAIQECESMMMMG